MAPGLLAAPAGFARLVTSGYKGFVISVLRWFFWLAACCAIVWFSVTVQLGSRTLWGHLGAIAGTREARSLAEGTREEAGKVAEKVRQGWSPGGTSSPAKGAPDPASADDSTAATGAETRDGTRRTVRAAGEHRSRTNEPR